MKHFLTCYYFDSFFFNCFISSFLCYLCIGIKQLNNIFSCIKKLINITWWFFLFFRFMTSFFKCFILPSILFWCSDAFFLFEWCFLIFYFFKKKPVGLVILRKLIYLSGLDLYLILLQSIWSFKLSVFKNLLL